MKSPRKSTRKPVRKSTSKVAKKVGKRRTSKPVDINQIAQAIANEIKTKNALPGMTLPVELLRTLFVPATDAEITAALQQLAGQQILTMRPDGSFAVASPGAG